MNFTEWTNKVEALEKAKHEALARYIYANQICNRAFMENPSGGAVLEFAQRIEKEASDAYDAAKAAHKAALDEKQPEPVESVTVAICEGEFGTVGNIGQVGEPFPEMAYSTQHTRWGMHKLRSCYYSYLFGQMWFSLDGKHRLSETAPATVKSGASWREQIVEEQIRQDGDAC